MNRSILFVRSVFVLGFVLLAMSGPASSAFAQDAEQGAHFATRSGLHFYAGGDVNVTTPATTVFATGGDIKINGNDIGEIFAAGGEISLLDIVTNRVIAAAGQIDISGTITKSVIAAGGAVDIRKGSKIDGDVVVGANRLNFDGDVGGDFIAAAHTITLAGHILGDVTLRGRTMTLLPGTRIDGDLTYRSRDELVIPEGVRIAGTVTREGNMWSADVSGLFGVLTAVAVAFFCAIFALLILASVALALLGRPLANAAAIISARPLGSIGIGIVLAMVLPFVATILMLTIIGIPLGLLVLAAYGILFGLGFIVAAYGIGLKLRAMTGPRDVPPRYLAALGWTLLGLFVFAFIGAVPLIGNIVQFFAVVAGFGALILSMTGDRKTPLAFGPT